MNVSLALPLAEEDVRQLKVGDFVELSGVITTARDSAHKLLAGGTPCPRDVSGGVFYHCGPVIVGCPGAWRVTAAGPTTSIREEPYMADLIGSLGLRAVIGKGGMGQKTSDALRRHGCVYLHAVGGVAQVLAECIQAVEGVDFLEEFGPPEAMWHLRVERFPAMVTMDTQGNGLHTEISAISASRLAACVAMGGGEV
ncbi:MAG: fumarate hydratase C-terminal domain-containing protein [Lentisphaeria bacterium]|nr:fumarate hydratase C-terminal domain-containing protein [Lentisphaeria bacterium]